jgi:ABC-2 type transport system ATP-binding protein
MQPSAAIQLDSLSKTYRSKSGGPVRAVRSVSLSVPEGQVFGFLGPNGAGKTTTVKMICGLVRPTAGQVTINGYDVWRRRSVAVRQIGAVLEGTRNVHWPLSAWDNLVYFGNLKGAGGRHLGARAEQLLRELDLWDRRKDLVRTFSRVKRLAREQGKTVVLTTHQLDLAEELCDRVAIVNKGRVIANEPVGELLNLFSEEYYQIKVEECLPGADSRFDGFHVTEENGNTVLTGLIADQEALHAVLDRLRALGLRLLSASRVEPNLEEAFVRVLDSDAAQGEMPE